MGKEKLLSKIFIRFLMTAGLSFAIPYAAFATPKASASEVEKDPTYNTTIVKDYINKCNDTFRELESNGISMKNANDKASVKAYVRSLLPEPEFSYSELAVAIYNSPPGLTSQMDFKSAVAGTRSNIYGESGHCYLTIILRTDEYPDWIWIESDKISILPIPYSGSTHSGGGGRGSSKSGKIITDNSISITKPSIYEGTWETNGNNWNLRLNTGTLAASQWAYIKNTWYLFDSNGNMITGWKKANNKWYYMDPTGAMSTGWKLINGKYYFMNTNGEMLENTTTPDGYKVNKNGEWIH